MEDVIGRAVLFGGAAVVSAANMSRSVDTARRLHELDEGACEALGRILIVAGFMSSTLKNVSDRLTLIVEGDGSGGKIVVCGDYGAAVRGYIEHPRAEGARCGDVIGKNGYLNVVHDTGEALPYNGVSAIVNGSVDADFAYYYTVSEQLPTALATGVEYVDGHIAAGGVLVQPMPGCGEEILVVLQDIVREFTRPASLVAAMTPHEVIERYFGQFEHEFLPDVSPIYRCNCSRAKIESAVRGLGEKEARDIIAELGKISVHCEFCDKDYDFDESDVDKMWSKHGRNL